MPHAAPGTPRAYPEPPRASPADEAFWRFHERNPRVYALLVAFARRAKAAGAARVGVRMLWERMRWEVQVETADPAGDEWKLNDHYTSRYARLLMAREPDLRGLFETRELRD